MRHMTELESSSNRKISNDRKIFNDRESSYNRESSSIKTYNSEDIGIVMTTMTYKRYSASESSSWSASIMVGAVVAGATERSIAMC